MATDVVFTGPLNGRFFKVAPSPIAGTSFVESAMKLAWESGTGKGLSFVRRFCTGVVPYDGDLGEDPTPLSYSDGGHGIWRLWFREESRTVGRNAVEERASSMALDRDSDTSLSNLPRSVRKELMDEARRELLKVVVPKIRIVPVMVSSEWAWIGRRTAAEDRSYVHVLRSVLGSLEFDPLVWDADETEWTACSYATLLAFVKAQGGELAPDVFLTDIEIKGGSVHLKISESEDEVRSMVERLCHTAADGSVKKLTFEVHKDGTPISIDIDAEGLYRGRPLRSAGGLPHDRISRRFADVRYAAGRAGQVMKDLVAQVEASD